MARRSKKRKLQAVGIGRIAAMGAGAVVPVAATLAAVEQNLSSKGQQSSPYNMPDMTSPQTPRSRRVPFLNRGGAFVNPINPLNPPTLPPGTEPISSGTEVAVRGNGAAVARGKGANNNRGKLLDAAAKALATYNTAKKAYEAGQLALNDLKKLKKDYEDMVKKINFKKKPRSGGNNGGNNMKEAGGNPLIGYGGYSAKPESVSISTGIYSGLIVNPREDFN